MGFRFHQSACRVAFPAAAGSAMMNLTVQVPAGAPPGALVQFTAPNGQPVQAQIPQGLGPGAQVTIAALPPVWKSTVGRA